MAPARMSRRVVGTLTLLAAFVAAGIGSAPPAAAQSGLTITTAFPSVSVQPGASVSFELTVAAEEPVRVALGVEGLPDGWTASLSGGGNEVHGVYVVPDEPTTVSLSVDVPEDADGGATTIRVVGEAAGDTVSLPLDLTVTEAGGGTVSLESDYPSLRGSVDEQFQFNLTLSNDTPQQLTFNLEAQGPGGWDVSIQPSGETRAASVTVDARATQRLEVTTTPPPQTEAGTYPVAVQVSAGDQRAVAELAVEVTGSVEMSLTTTDGRLNTTANAGAVRDLDMTVVNSGTSPLVGVQLSGTGPSEWQIEFEPATLDQVAPGQSVPVVAHITPSGNAVAGDYVVSLSASGESASESVEIRVTVETAPIWGIVGAALIVATLAGMVWVFRRYGRR